MKISGKRKARWVEQIMPFGRPLPVMIGCVPHNMSGAVTRIYKCFMTLNATLNSSGWAAGANNTMDLETSPPAHF
jgi:hypothetical protein